MSTFYYLISSLPSISLWEMPEINTDRLFDICDEWLSVKEMEVLKQVELSPNENIRKHIPTLVKWYNWETCLRNRLARHRSGKIDIDYTPYLREEHDYYSEIERIAQEAIAADTPLEKEKFLDEQRWSYLTNLEAGHIFNFDLVCIYKLKLMLCEKWLARDTERGKQNFDKALNELYKREMLEIN